MKRLLILLAALAAALLLPAAAAAAPRHEIGDGHHQVRSGRAHGAATNALAGKESFAPLGARLSGAATVYGTLSNSYGSPTGGAPLEWYSLVDGSWVWGEGTTAGDGSFSMTVSPTTNGELWAYPGADSAFARGDETWSNGGSYGRTLYPGRVSVTGHRGGRWGDFDKLVVRLSGSARYSKGAVTAGDTSTTPVSGLIDVLDGNYSGGSAKFFWDEGLEFFGSIGVTSGVTSGAAVSVNEADAQRVWMKSPYWYSGKPGATVKIARNNFPAGWSNLVTGYTDDPSETASKTFGTLTSSGTATENLSVKVPSAAKPGYGYWMGFQHVDGSGNEYPLYLEEMYQVCTMKPSKTAIHKGTKIRVTGVIPTEGHWGSQAGLKKVVTLYAHKGTAGVPTKWNPKSKGWVKVGSVSAAGSGVYTTPYFKPLKTLTLVVRYPGDDWYFDAYTSARKITVR